MNKKYKNLYRLLKARPFCNCAIKEKNIYSAYCLRIIETLEMWEEENAKRQTKGFKK